MSDYTKIILGQVDRVHSVLIFLTALIHGFLFLSGVIMVIFISMNFFEELLRKSVRNHRVMSKKCGSLHFMFPVTKGKGK